MKPVSLSLVALTFPPGTPGTNGSPTRHPRRHPAPGLKTILSKHPTRQEPTQPGENARTRTRVRQGAEGMVCAHTDVAEQHALREICWVDPHHAQRAALGFGGSDLVGGCVWADGCEGGGCGDGQEEGGEGFHVGVELDQAMGLAWRG
ncbi:uncharacterized protein DSM5745_01826 [Aspergillus mulundensis]|uniref:Uncharacterized protein n=1 Tax=Aspergillus mulundensis TaxID=1810919 RepID=A0A3D8SV42_9EURO|nr:hypothetical protein DSM5745_01826 [Aspergillus mulundensis]RDW90051.1 hypothetical protein DSM5745_01826 [Aspergillus mulundensis]